MDIIRHAGHPGAMRIEPPNNFPLVERILWVDHSRIVVPKYKMTQQIHHFHQLDVILGGEFQLTLENGVIETGFPGDAWIIPPLVWHGVNCSHPFYYCSFKFCLSPQFWPLFGTTFHRFTIPPELRSEVESLGERCEKTGAFIGQQISSLISLCLIKYADQAPEQEEPPHKLKEFHQWLWPLLEKIHSAPDINWSVTRMAKEVGLSADYFSRCFRQVIGQTPQRYILEATMRSSAAHLLEHPQLPIKSIAEKAGYADVAAFTHAFTRVFKISPAAYRRRVLET